MQQSDLDFLKSLPRFRALGETEMMMVARCCTEEEVRGGNMLFDVGDESNGAYVVREGTLLVQLPMPDGSARVLAKLGQGAVVGELCLIEDAPRSLRVRAGEDCRLVLIQKEPFAALRAKGHSGVYKLIRSMALTVCDRLRNTNMQIESRWRGGTTEATEEKGVDDQPRSAWDKLRTLFGRS